MFSIRKARKSDLPLIEEMIMVIFPDVRNRMLPDDRFFIAERSGIPVGFCHLRFREKSCYIVGLGVLPQYRAHGAGSQLLAEAIYTADRMGLQTIYLRVRALNRATKLYVKMGFFERRAGDTLTLVRKRPS